MMDICKQSVYQILSILAKTVVAFLVMFICSAGLFVFVMVLLAFVTWDAGVLNDMVSYGALRFLVALSIFLSAWFALDLVNGKLDKTP